MSCGVDCRHGLDLALLWLWCRLAATALIQPLAWELPQAAAIKKKKKKKSSRCGTAEMNPTSDHEVACLIPGLTQWVKDPALP